MKKTLTVILSAVFAMLVLTGCSDKVEQFVSSYTADAKKTAKVVIDVRDREIEVMPSNDSKIHIDYSESDKEYYSISVSDGNVLTMTAENDKSWTDYIGKAVCRR